MSPEAATTVTWRLAAVWSAAFTLLACARLTQWSPPICPAALGDMTPPSVLPRRSEATAAETRLLGLFQDVEGNRRMTRGGCGGSARRRSGCGATIAGRMSRRAGGGEQPYRHCQAGHATRQPMAPRDARTEPDHACLPDAATIHRKYTLRVYSSWAGRSPWAGASRGCVPQASYAARAIVTAA